MEVQPLDLLLRVNFMSIWIYVPRLRYFGTKALGKSMGDWILRVIAKYWVVIDARSLDDRVTISNGL
jgi:hypothetical protein